MLGGKDDDMIIKAARAVEMIHAYVLMVDDIADRSNTRRGGPAAHKIMEKYHHTNALKNEGAHFGESMATQAALIGGYLAELIIDDLDVPAEIKLVVLKNFHGNLVRTGHGQLRDILNEVLPEVTEDDALWTAKYKTAYYTVINPLETGALLAGAKKDDLKIIKEFGMHAGIGFQIADDILGIFGNDNTTGKSSLDDLKEGKITVLITYALAHGNTSQRKELISTLGNPKITEQDLFACQKIITEVGAREYAWQKAQALSTKAKEVLSASPSYWSIESVDFLKYLSELFIERKS
jgi:geranylgeranyl diphosphate synthase type I